MVLKEKWLIFYVCFFYHYSVECLEFNTGLQYACSEIRLECPEKDRIWVRGAFLVSLPLNPTTTPNQISEATSTQPPCSVNYTSLLTQPYCDITEAVVIICSHLLICQVSLATFASSCAASSAWSDVAVVVDDLICLPKTTDENQYYLTLDVTSEYYKDTNITSQYFYLTTPSYPSLWWYPIQSPQNSGSMQKNPKEFDDLKICSIKYSTESIQLIVIDFKAKIDQNLVEISGKSGIPKIDLMLDKCPIIFAQSDSSDNVTCVGYGNELSYRFSKSSSSTYSHLLVVFRPTSYSKLNLLINVYDDKRVGLECNTPAVLSNVFTEVTTASTPGTTAPSNTTGIYRKAEVTSERPLDVIIGASVAAAVVLLALVALVACVAIRRKKNYKQNKPESSQKDDLPSEPPSNGKVNRHSSFLQAFKPVSIHSKVYDKFRNMNVKSQSGVASYYAGESSQSLRVGKRNDGELSNGKDLSQPKASNGKCIKEKKKYQKGKDPHQEMGIIPSSVDITENSTQGHNIPQPPPFIPITPNHIPRPTLQQHPVFPNQPNKILNQPTLATIEDTDEDSVKALPIEQIKSKLQNLHRTQLENHTSHSPHIPPPPEFSFQNHSYSYDEDIYANASEI